MDIVYWFLYCSSFTRSSLDFATTKRLSFFLSIIRNHDFSFGWHYKIHDADAVVMGSPIYFSEVTGIMRCFIERFLFQYLNYDDFSKPLSPAKKIAMVYTMNIAEPMLEQFGYNALFQRYENWMKNFFGSCTTLLCTETMQVKDYNRYHLGAFNGDERKKRHETIFLEDCQKAYNLGGALTK